MNEYTAAELDPVNIMRSQSPPLLWDVSPLWRGIEEEFWREATKDFVIVDGYAVGYWDKAPTERV